MSYVTARGGEEAIRAAEALYRSLLGRLTPAFHEQLEARLPYLLDRLMGEGGVWAPRLAALALAQTGGDLYEGVLLLRAYRTTLPRLSPALALSREELCLLRRISAAFKAIPEGQVLGPTLDYSQRLLRLEALYRAEAPPPPPEAARPAPERYPSVSGWLRRKGLLQAPREAAEGLPDLTTEPLRFPAPRPLALQALARADTGGLLALGYSGMRAYNAHYHPTVSELGLGYAEVRLPHPVRGGAFAIGEVRLSFAEVVAPAQPGEPYRLGFAATLGWNEVKVIAAALLELEMQREEPHPARSQEFVLLHTDPVEASGFALHYKLPHYVTFLSNLLAHQGQPEEVEDA
ncbi:MAG: carbon-phosphorus lyase complex subunit PhnI [Meiothermus sp.]|uniref:carbon-phosphorus lyase complex subunit PhnI n=1 Tax=Meiothermus sp. TaxID=1955249 RepID=UPI0025E4C5E8|nr:carbon-phosphorus lyase complex subunit PhnI [Meiothermus sp.]MCS7193367.1 carbon-phosphorus lyase complex subunit PhnI [Meiothermus sp.]MDW8091776.1 carbon-phosphorus lyase complex subunit PhnI [Meiothermus sp.]